MKKVTFKDFFSTLFCGVWQLVKWFLSLFGYKDESTLGIALRRIFSVCVTSMVVLFTGFVFYSFVSEVVCDKWLYQCFKTPSVWDERYISSNIVFQLMTDSEANRVYDLNNDKVLLEKVDWVVTSDDSLAVFARNGKRGYINRFTGVVAIPETYTRAWVFSEGLAAVEKDGELLFIDHSGKVVIDRDFIVYYDEPGYAFKNGYCMIKEPVKGKIGLIDRNGDWALEPEYYNLFNNEGFWQVEKDGCVGLYTADIDVMFPVENEQITISDSVIEVYHADHTAKQYDFYGNVLVDFVIDEVCNLQYETDKIKNEVSEYEDEEVNNRIYGIANCMSYKVAPGYYEEYYGLLSRDGRRITPPLYTSIEAIAKDRYLCHPHGVIIDDDGNVVE